MEYNKIYNEDCFATLKRFREKAIDVVLTSPPYNTGRVSTSERSRNNYESRYDIHLDNQSTDEYLEWSVNLFNEIDTALKENGVILYNISYGAEKNADLLWLLLAELINKTNFMVADCITWKKSSALPNNVSRNKLTRITEFVFVFCRKTEYSTYFANKKVKSVSRTGQKYYENIFNFIEARNNDGTCPLNKATYSSELCDKLLSMYAPANAVVYDPFMGTGTTAVSCKRLGLRYVGSELSPRQVEWAENRLAVS